MSEESVNRGRRIADYFALRERRDELQPQDSGAGEGVPFACLPQYAALFAGILCQKFFNTYLETGQWTLRGFWGWFLAAAILGVLAFPAVYTRTRDPQKHWFVQLCFIFTAGMGWQSLVKVGGGAVLETVTGSG